MRDARTEKLPYMTPKLLVHGSLAEMTQAPPFNCNNWPGNGGLPPPFSCGSGDELILPGRRNGP
jgi:hypothetical protein